MRKRGRRRERERDRKDRNAITGNARGERSIPFAIVSAEMCVKLVTHVLAMQEEDEGVRGEAQCVGRTRESRREDRRVRDL